MTYFIASVPVGKIQTYKTEIFFCLKAFYLFFLSMVGFKP